MVSLENLAKIQNIRKAAISAGFEKSQLVDKKIIDKNGHLTTRKVKVDELDNKKAELSKEVEQLIKLKKKLYSNVDIESSMSEDEKELDKKIAGKFSEINDAVREKHKMLKEDKTNHKNTRPSLINEGFKNTNPAKIEWIGERKPIDLSAKNISNSLDKSIVSAGKACKKHGVSYQIMKTGYNTNISPINKYYIPVTSSTKLFIVFEEDGQTWCQTAKFS